METSNIFAIMVMNAGIILVVWGIRPLFVELYHWVALRIKMTNYRKQFDIQHKTLQNVLTTIDSFIIKTESLDRLSLQKTPSYRRQ